MKKFLIRPCLLLSFVTIALSVAGCKLDDSQSKLEIRCDNSDPNSSVCLNGENTVYLCSDGIDNDNNGVADCDDPNCSYVDDFGNGPGATVCAPGEESNIYQCRDGKDNDGDGYIDCNDNSCKSTAACCTISTDSNGLAYQEGDILLIKNGGRIVEICREGSGIDCEASCTTEGVTCIYTCMNGEDDDCNGYTDCEDNRCKKSNYATVKEHCEKQICEGRGAGCMTDESSLEACSDGVDNDMDGYIDCKDRSCQNSAAAKEYCNGQVVREDPENTQTACSDGKDNDLDGLIDCDDSDCKQFCN